MSDTSQQKDGTPMRGEIPVAGGLPAVLRIPVPNSNGLAIEFRPRGHVPKGGTTSTLFIQSPNGKQHLRLDYGFNKNTGKIEWHWNQKGTNKVFGIKNHTTVGRAGQVAGNAARYFKYAGRTLVVVGAAMDAYSIVTASKPLRRTVQVVSAWGAAAAGCKVVGAGGAAVGSAAPGLGTAAGGIIGCAVGGFFGYITAEAVSGYIYDWAEDTIFTPLPELQTAQ
ncbi:MAG: hypothetical protein AAF074_13905 [Pseudomonadota bacterium]